MLYLVLQSLQCLKFKLFTLLRIRRGNRDNWAYLPLKHICDPSLEPSRGDGLMRGHNICFH